MTIHIPVPPARIVALGGPVSAAIRAMRADEPATDYTRIRELRRAIADRIEADIALLDALCGDADIEQDAGEMPEIDAGDEPEPEEDFELSLSGITVSWPLPHDLEDEHDGREPSEDGEPSLCGLTVWAGDFHNPDVYLDGEMDGGDMREADADFEPDNRNLRTVAEYEADRAAGGL